MNTRQEGAETADEVRERLNAAELDLMRAIIVSLSNDAEAVRKLFAVINQVLIQEKINLSISQGVDTLQSLVLRALNGRMKKFDAELKSWVKYYRALEVKATKKMSALVTRQGRNITRSVLEGSPHVDTVWGDEVDLRLVLSGLMTDPYDPHAIFLSNSTYTLPPVPITDQASSLSPVYALRDLIKKVIAKSPAGKYINLIIPVVCADSHWQLLRVTLKEGQVSYAQLVDSLPKDNKALMSQSSYINAQLVVNKVNEKASVRVEALATGKQTDGHSCFDWVMKETFLLMPDSYLSQTSVAICLANDATRLRHAIIGKIFENHPNLKTKMTTPVKKIGKASPVGKSIELSAKEKILHEVFAEENVDAVHHQLVKLQGTEDRHIQIEFDALLAAELAQKNDSSVQFDLAWQAAYSAILKKYGIFRQPEQTENKNSSNHILKV